MEEIKNENPSGVEESAETQEDKKAAANEPKEKKTRGKEKELLAKIEELEAASREKDDKYLRLAAEYDNFRRRSREEKDATYEHAMADTVSELLPIIDNLERAAAFSADSSVKDGLVMIFKSVEAVFSKLGIEAFGNKGDKFDPNLHNAVMHEENAEFGEGEISEVFQKGYKKGNKIIRFAMVKTAN